MLPDWLDIGDKIASVVGAAAGVTALLIQVLAAPTRQPVDGEAQDRRVRPWAGRLSFTALAAACAVALVSAALAAARGEPSLQLGAAIILVAVTAAVHRAVLRRQPVPLRPAVRRLLAGQRREAERHRYHLTGTHLPRVTTLYVQQRAEAGLGHGGRTAPADGGPMTPVEIIARYRHAVVVAEPGAGKSTLTAHLAAASCGWWQGARRGTRSKSPFGEAVAVRLPASRLVGKDLPAALAEHWSGQGEQVSPDLFAAPPLDGARWLVLVDGVDEITDPDERSQVLTMLSSAVEEKSDVFRFLITTRPLPLGELADLVLAGAADLRLRLFDAADLQRFAQRWFEARPVAGAGADPPELARAFVAGLGRSAVSALARVPLLVTMAALLHERDPAAGPPADRTRLYEEFVALLRTARRWDTGIGEEGWTAHEDDLLCHLAALRVHHPEQHLLQAAVEWTAARIPSAAPQGMTRAVLTGTVLNRLLATSLLLADGTDVAFLHQSLAEYLAAGAETFDEAVWRRDMANPSTREFALFVLGRSGPPVAELLPRLLDGTDAGQVAAGRVLTDGYRVPPAMADAVIAGLLSLVRSGRHGEECLDVLVDLAASRPELMARLAEVTRDAEVPAWTRAIVADVLADVNRQTACALLTDIGLDDRLGAHPVRRWCAGRLESHGNYRAADRVRRSVTGDGEWAVFWWPSFALDELLPPLPSMPERALAALADDPRQDVMVRIQAVTALLEHSPSPATRILLHIATGQNHDVRARFEAARVLVRRVGPAVLTGMQALADDPAAEDMMKYEAASLLIEHQDPHGLAVMAELARSARESWIRFRSARTLCDHGDADGLDILRLLATSERTGLRTRVAAGRLLLDRADEPTRQALLGTLSDGRRLSVRYGAAFALCGTDPAGAVALRDLAAHSRIGPYARHAIGVALARTADPAGTDVLRAQATGSPDGRARVMAAHALSRHDPEAAAAALRATLDDARADSGARYQAALSLLDLGVEVSLAQLATQLPEVVLRVAIGETLVDRGDSTGIPVLREALLSQRLNGRVIEGPVRRRAANALAQFGEPGRELLRQIAETEPQRSRWRLEAGPGWCALVALAWADGVKDPEWFAARVPRRRLRWFESEVVEVLGQIPGTQPQAVLERLARHRAAAGRQIRLACVPKIAADPDALTRVAEDGTADPLVRCYAAAYLLDEGRTGTALAVLTGLRDNHPGPLVRRLSGQLIETHAGRQAEPLPRLWRLLLQDWYNVDLPA
ncbi:NACHT domain-containing protein [Nonomuraea sp. H19]|uniref:NACHT domain-containing protein n=1 Tax=Nonomuraea sp. H19 TaxID=3452206 RepID=UPI003F8B3C84